MKNPPARQAALVIAAALISGCATVAAWLDEPKLQRDYWSLEGLQARESQDPAAARAAYQRMLREVPAPALSYPDYAKRLSEQLEGLRGRQTTKSRGGISGDAVLGIGCYYDLRWETLARIHIGIARTLFAENKVQEAEPEAAAAKEIAESKLLSPYRIYSVSKDAYALLEKIHAQLGARGKALVARHAQRILSDYAGSEQGKTDFFLDRQSLKEGHEAVENINIFIANVNFSRAEANSKAFNTYAAGITAVAAGFAQVNINRQLAQNGGVMNSQIRMLQMQKMLLDYSSQSLLVAAGVLPQASASAPSGAAGASNPILISQLFDSTMGGNVVGNIKDFCRAAAQLSDSSRLRAAADTVTKAADTLQNAQRQKGPQASAPEAARLADAVGKLQQEVSAVK